MKRLLPFVKNADKIPANVRFNPLYLICLRIPLLHEGQLPTA